MWANSRICALARLSSTLFILFLGAGLLLSACQANVSSEPNRASLNIPPDPGAQLAGPTQTPSAPILFPPTVTAIPAPSPTPTAPLPAVAVLPTVPLLPFPSPTSAAASGLRAEIIAAKLNVRQGPGVTYPVIGAATKGEGFDISGLSSNKNWLQIVTAEGGPGWISA
ncbi:MAG: SH3 domain-containing protein [Anaerolineae bacterium]|nr:SH3 domain-containing protein [Anaerolineae bacterium]